MIRALTMQNSIRHNLSMNPAFINVERPLSEGGLGTGKGGYWKVSEDVSAQYTVLATPLATLF